jgi:hypothetical protein
MPDLLVEPVAAARERELDQRRVLLALALERRLPHGRVQRKVALHGREFGRERAFGRRMHARAALARQSAAGDRECPSMRACAAPLRRPSVSFRCAREGMQGAGRAPMSIASFARHSANLLRRFVLIERSRRSFADGSSAGSSARMPDGGDDGGGRASLRGSARAQQSEFRRAQQDKRGGAAHRAQSRLRPA